MISAIIVAAGNSRRMGFDKLAADLCGKPVIARSLAAFECCKMVSEIIVVTSSDRFELIDQYKTSKVSQVIEGGAERHFSVSNGLGKTMGESTLIAVHDGARPLVTPESIISCAEAALETGAASLATRVVDTLKRSTAGGNIVADSVSRNDLWAMETPQIFQREILVSAYRDILERGELVTDEVSAVQSTGHEVQLVENTSPNFKITLPGDLDLARSVSAGRGWG